jgi:hypothetical protein
MNLEPGVFYGGIGTAGLVLGWIVRGTRAFAGKEKDVETVQRDISVLMKLYDTLEANLSKHTGDRDFHIDPRRDAATLQGLRDQVAQGFEAAGARQAEILAHLEKIDSRCEKRISDCSDHFAKIRERISAVTGKANGREDERR